MHSSRECSVLGCAGKATRRGWCDPHYRRWQRHGDPLGGLRTTEERFWAKVAKAGPNDCWEWTAARYRNDYGRIWSSEHGRKLLAHRYSYRLHHGVDLTPDVMVCHSCDNRCCVNPAHLWLGSASDNQADMAAKGRGRKPRLVRSGECPHGHSLADAYTIRTRSGAESLRCRACASEMNRKQYERRRAAR